MIRSNRLAGLRVPMPLGLYFKADCGWCGGGGLGIEEDLEQFPPTLHFGASYPCRCARPHRYDTVTVIRRFDVHGLLPLEPWQGESITQRGEAELNIIESWLPWWRRWWRKAKRPR